ncbi:MAG: AmmeMemoRadiSam system protein B [Bacteroidia bacterium]|nr:AmmeMemoRadiSam system protein B [Bacteroidia bacterium]
MKTSILVLLLLSIFSNAFPQPIKIRNQRDTVGFASNCIQMDSVMNRIWREKFSQINYIRKEKKISAETIFRVAICPHDDYTYAGYLYPLSLENIKAGTVIIFGVAHKIKIRDKIIFENFDQWKSAYGNIKISPLREKIIQGLSKNFYLTDDSIHAREHSVEAMVPFLQYYNRKVEIIPILVPNMPADTLQILAKNLAGVIHSILVSQNLKWGEDIAMVISNDAVHYGDQDWGGKNFALLGSDSSGYKKALAYEHKLIHDYLVPEFTISKIISFISELVDKNSGYKWTWCGRNSVPFGLLTSLYLQEKTQTPKLNGLFLDYSTSIMNKPIKVDDLKIGATAPANIHHWVGYVAIGYK